MPRLAIVTLNTWQKEGPFEARWALLAEEARALAPDVFCFQEIADAHHAKVIASEWGLQYAYSDDMSWLLTLSRTKIDDAQYLRYACQSPTEGYTRGVLAARILSPGERDICVLNTHLSWKPAEEGVRVEQVRELDSFVNRYAGKDTALIMGDFNASPDTDAVGFLTKKAGWVDLYASMHPGKPGLTWDNRNAFTASHGMPDRRVDYIFLKDPSGRWRPEIVDLAFQRERNGVYPSDHFGLFGHVSRL